MLTDADVWKAAQKHGGISVPYGTKTDVYEIIMQGDSKNKCCVVVSENGVIDATVKRIAKSINDRCYIVKSLTALEKVMQKIAKSTT